MPPSYSIRPWPLDRLEHELESFSEFLRSFPQCPEEVRIRQEEGGGDNLPMIIIDVVGAGTTDLGPHAYQDTRDISLMWYGSHGGDVHREKNQALDWLTNALVRFDDRHRGLIPIKDYSDPEDVTETDYWIFIDDGSVSATPRPDEYGNWTIAVELNYTVDHGVRIPAPAVPDPATVPHITDVEYEVNHE